MFEPSQHEVWEEVAKEFKGHHFPSTLTSMARLNIPFRSSVIMVSDNYKNGLHFTKIAALYPKEKGVLFKIRDKNLIEKMLNIKHHSILIGKNSFDARFILKSPEPLITKKIFSSKRIQQGLLNLKQVRFSSQDHDSLFFDNVSNDERMLLFKRRGIIKDHEELKNIIQLFFEFLNVLYLEGSYI